MLRYSKTPLYKGLEPLWILFAKGSPGTSPLWVPNDDCDRDTASLFYELQRCNMLSEVSLYSRKIHKAGRHTVHDQ